MIRLLTGCIVFVAAATAAPAQLTPLGGPSKVPAWYTAAVQGVDATFEPAEAKPGQTVTLKVTVRLNPGYHTYPLKQAEPGAAPYVNTIKYPAAGAVVFVGEPETLGVKTKADEFLKLEELGYVPGTAVYARQAVVVPTAAAGPVTVTLPSFKLSVCDKDNCYPPRTLTPTATLTVLPGPAVGVDPAYADAVKKAGGL